MRLYYSYGVCLLAAAGVVAACRGAGPRKDGARGAPAPASSSEPAAAAFGPAPTDSLTVGCTGGFSGGGGGLIVTGNGEILEWGQQTYAPPRTYRLVRVDTAATAAIYRELVRIGFRKLPAGEPANVTCSIEVSGPSGSHSVSWPLGRPPAAVKSLYEKLRALDPGALTSQTMAPSALPLRLVSLRRGRSHATVDTLISGCTGGKTGGGRGTMVTSHGEIFDWQLDLATHPRRYRLMRVDSVDTALAFAEVERSHLRSMNLHESDNVTCFLELSGAGGAHRVSWPDGVTPKAVDHLFTLLNALAHPDG